jgi:hypothetical protein
MVLFDHMFVFFALYERKKDKREKGKYRLSKPAGAAKDLCFGNERSFAAAQDDNPKDGK